MRRGRSATLAVAAVLLVLGGAQARRGAEVAWAATQPPGRPVLPPAPPAPGRRRWRGAYSTALLLALAGPQPPRVDAQQLAAADKTVGRRARVAPRDEGRGHLYKAGERQKETVHDEAAFDSTADLFGRLDLDRDGRISEQEFKHWLPGGKGLVTELSQFFLQADLDDDGMLKPEEVHFVRLLWHEADFREHLEGFTHKMPPGFLDSLSAGFDKLRKDLPGRARFDQITQTLSLALSGKKDLQVDDAAKQMMWDLFRRADVVQDGGLNLNELDFFELMLYEAVAHTVQESDLKAGPEAPGTAREDREAEARALMQKFDLDEDGALDQRETLAGLASAFQDSGSSIYNFFEETATDVFTTLDQDGDGLLDATEIDALIDLLWY